MKGRDLIAIALSLLFLCGIIILIIFLFSIARYQSFLLVAGCIAAVIMVVLIGYFLNKRRE